MINFIINRLLKRAGLSPENLQDLVERGTKELDELDDILDRFGKDSETIKDAFEGWQTSVSAELRKAKEDADKRRAKQDEKIKRAGQLDDMLQRLRPGMHIRELDQIVRVRTH